MVGAAAGNVAARCRPEQGDLRAAMRVARTADQHPNVPNSARAYPITYAFNCIFAPTVAAIIIEPYDSYLEPRIRGRRQRVHIVTAAYRTPRRLHGADHGIYAFLRFSLIPVTVIRSAAQPRNVCSNS